VTAKDYETDDTALITKRVLDGAGRDGIILLHPLHKGTVPAMPSILKALSKQGYTFVTVSQLLAPAKAEPGAINRNDGGRGVYFDDPDGHFLEIITRPYGIGD